MIKIQRGARLNPKVMKFSPSFASCITWELGGCSWHVLEKGEGMLFQFGHVLWNIHGYKGAG